MKLIAFFASCLFALPALASGDRVALVVGNGNYSEVSPLSNPERDARAVAATLERVGFDVILGVDMGIGEMRDAVRSFSEIAEGAAVALFYYAGHGMQVGGKNYLVPVDATIDREADLDFATIELELVLRQLERSAGSRVILLDACRDNPFETRLSRSMGAARSSASLGRGLAPVETDGGAFIGFATDPGEVAFDGIGRHSPFTQALLNHLETPGLEINALMTRVRAEVFRETDRLQRPWSTSSLLNELYLAPEDEIAPDQADPLLAEIEVWRRVQSDGSREIVSAYLERYPEGIFSEVAREMLAADPSTQETVVAALPSTPDTPDPPDPVEKAEPAVPSRAAEPVSPSRECPECPRMVAIPGGTFLMGSAADGAPEAERPATAVNIVPFHMSETEITVAQFEHFLSESGHWYGVGCFVWTPDGRMRKDAQATFRLPGHETGPGSPAACVTWNDAQAYADWLSAKSGYPHRLPSEAEMEYVIRAGTTGSFPWEGGAAAACGLVNAADASSRFRWRNRECTDGVPDLALAGSFPANAFGLRDVVGSLWEWTADCWNGSHRGARSDGQARTDGLCSSRVVRGASWDDPPQNLRSSYRVGIPAERRQANVGFRVVRASE